VRDVDRDWDQESDREDQRLRRVATTEEAEDFAFPERREFASPWREPILRLCRLQQCNRRRNPGRLSAHAIDPTRARRPSRAARRSMRKRFLVI